jgi:hypothetical protein
MWACIKEDILTSPCFAANTDTEFLPQIQHSAGGTGRCPFGKKSGFCMREFCLILPPQSGNILTIPIQKNGYAAAEQSHGPCIYLIYICQTLVW